jgi:hypothetical protein
MISNRQLLSALEKWISAHVPEKYRAVWVDINPDTFPKLDCKYYDSYGSTQSIILKNICVKNNIPYYIHSMNSFNSDQDRLKEYSKFIDWKSENYDTVLFSKLLKEQVYFGEFKKYSCDNLDFFPFGDLTKSQLDALHSYIETGQDIVSVMSSSFLEWLYLQDIHFNIISSSESPTKNIRWATYSLEQKSLVAKYYSLIRSRSHKINKNNIFNYEF